MTRIKSLPKPEHGFQHRVHRSTKNRKPYKIDQLLLPELKIKKQRILEEDLDHQLKQAYG